MRWRRGTTLVEVSLALCLLAAAFAATAQMLTVCARQRKAAERQLAAQMEASNVAERIAAMRFDELSPPKLREMTLGPEALSALRDGTLEVDCTDLAAPDASHKHIAIEVAWPTLDGRRSVRLTTWKFAPPRQLP